MCADRPVGISGITVASRDVDATRDAWFRLAGATDAPALVVGGVAVGVCPAGRGPEGLTAVTLSCEDVMGTARLLERRGLQPSGTTLELADLTWRLAGTTGAMRVDSAGDIERLDHLVVRTEDPERAVAAYGARLGLELRLDRTLPRYRMRGLFFACGSTVVEVVSQLDERGELLVTGQKGDHFGGLAWRVPDVARARERLAGAGVDVSEVREGRKPGTSVVTVRDEHLRVPTLLVGPA